MSRSFALTERPLTALGILDGAFTIARTAPRTVLGLLAAFVLPTQLLVAWLQREILNDLDFDTFDPDNPAFLDSGEFGVGAFEGGIIAVAAPYIVLPFLGVAITHLVLGWRDGIDRTIWPCMRFALARTHIILAALVMTKVMQAVSLSLLTPMTMLVAPVIAAEGLNPFAAVARSFRLGRRSYGRLLGLLVLLVLVDFLLTSALSTAPIVAAALVGDWGWISYFALSLIAATVLTMLGVGSAVLAYFDLRNRTDGLDLQRRTAELARLDQAGGSGG